MPICILLYTFHLSQLSSVNCLNKDLCIYLVYIQNHVKLFEVVRKIVVRICRSASQGSVAVRTNAAIVCRLLCISRQGLDVGAYRRPECTVSKALWPVKSVAV